MAIEKIISGREGFDDAPVYNDYRYEGLQPQAIERRATNGEQFNLSVSRPGSGILWTQASGDIWNGSAYEYFNSVFKIDIATKQILERYYTNGWTFNIGAIDSSDNLLIWTENDAEEPIIYKCTGGSNTNSIPTKYIGLSDNPWHEYRSMVYGQDGNLYGLLHGGTRVYKITNIDWDAHTCTETAVTSGGDQYLICFLENAGHHAGRLYGVIWTPDDPAYADTESPTGTVAPSLGTIDGIGWIDTGTGAFTVVITDFYTKHAFPAADPMQTYAWDDDSDYGRYSWYPPHIGPDGNI